MLSMRCMRKANAAGGAVQGLMGGLLLGAALANGYASQAAQPYSSTHPKRVLVQHLHLLGPRGDVQARAAAPYCMPCCRHRIVAGAACRPASSESQDLHAQQ